MIQQEKAEIIAKTFKVSSENFKYAWILFFYWWN